MGLDPGEQVGASSLLGGQAFGAERAHLTIEPIDIDRQRPVIVDHDLAAHDHGCYVCAHRAFHKGLDNIEFRIDPWIARHPVEVDEDCVTLHAR